MKETGMGISLVGRWPVARGLIGVVSLLGIFSALVVLWLFFSPWLAFWGLILGLVFWLNPPVGLALLIPVISADQAEPVWSGVVISLSELELAVCVLVFVLSRTTKHQQDLGPISWDWLVGGGAFFLAVLLSAIVNNEWWRVLPHAARQSEFVVAGWMASNIAASLSSRRWVRISIVSCGILYPLVALSQSPWLGTTRSFATLGNPNQFGAYLNLLFPFLVVFWLLARSRAAELLLGSAVSLSLLAQISAQSRSAWVAMLAIIFCLTFWAVGKERAQALDARRRLFRLSILLIVFAATAIGTLWGVGGKQYFVRSWSAMRARIPAISSPSDVLGSRRLFFELGWAMWQDAPLLGIGPGNYEERVLEYSQIWGSQLERSKRPNRTIRSIASHLHNLYLQLAVNFGLLGLAGFLFLIGHIIRKEVLAWPVDPWAVCAVGLLVGFLVQNLLDVSFPSLGLEMGLLLGAAAPKADFQRVGSVG